MMLLSDNDVTAIAWKILLNGAESMAEDWIDEEGEFTDEDGDRIFQKQFEFISKLREVGPQ